MHILNLLVDPSVLGMATLILSVVWMLRDEKDRTRPILVMAMVLNCAYAFILTAVMGRENGMLPQKYDHVLFNLDRQLGITSTQIAARLQGSAVRVPLLVIYQCMVPMMICWYMVSRRSHSRGSVLFAYISEMVTGPIIYAIVPGCGPIYAFGTQWLRPADVSANTIRLSGMPNAFPSLHVGTAVIFVFFAQGVYWRSLAVGFFAATALATLSTGEHYVIDLVAGLAFGCFAANIGKGKLQNALMSLGLTLFWSLGVRLEYGFLLEHPIALRSFAALTIVFTALAIVKAWRPVSEAKEEVAAIGTEHVSAGMP